MFRFLIIVILLAVLTGCAYAIVGNELKDEESASQNIASESVPSQTSKPTPTLTATPTMPLEASTPEPTPSTDGPPYQEFFGEQPPYSGAVGWSPVALVNNEDATNPTWSRLRAFIERDDTDKGIYGSLKECADFAEELHNNAEAAGIRAAFVTLDFEEGEGHALNAFDTVDKGVVFIDCTGGRLTLPPICYALPSGEISCPEQDGPNYDKVAYVEIGKEYGMISLEVVQGFSYESYQQYETEWDAYQAAVDEFNADIRAYEDLHDRCGGYASVGECQRLLSWYDELELWETELEGQRTELGESRWEPMGVVEKVEVWW